MRKYVIPQGLKPTESELEKLCKIADKTGKVVIGFDSLKHCADIFFPGYKIRL